MAAAMVPAAGATAAPGWRHKPLPNLVLPGLVLPQPCLKVPVRERDAAESGGRDNITEAYSLYKERHISGGGHDMGAGVIGKGNHEAIDFKMRYGAPILAPADGVAFRTYQSWLMNTTFTRGGHTGRIGYGLGMWLLILHHLEGQYWWSKVAHCATIRQDIRYLKPTVDADGDWHEPSDGPDNLYVPDQVLWTMGTPVAQGEELATVGDTGIEYFDPATGWGWRDDYNDATGQVRPRDRLALPAWDDAIEPLTGKYGQIHYEFYRRFNGSPGSGETFDARRISVDPFGLYLPAYDGSPYEGYYTGPGHLWLANNRGQALFAG